MIAATLWPVFEHDHDRRTRATEGGEPLDCDIEIHDDLGTFSASVREFLEQREAENVLMLGLLGARPGDSSGDGLIMVRAAADGQTVFVAFRRGPHLVVTRGPDVALVATTARLGALGLEVPGVM